MTETVQEENVSAKLQKIANHLVFLEKKIDILIEKSSSYDAPRRPFVSGGFRPREGRGPFVPRGRREGYPAKNYNGPQGPHGTRTARYEGKKFQPHRSERH